MADMMFAWTLACCLAGGFAIGTWAAHALQWLYKRCCRRSWSAEEIMRREG